MTPFLYMLAGVLFVVGYAGKRSENPTKQKIFSIIYYVSIVYALGTLCFDMLGLGKVMGLY